MKISEFNDWLSLIANLGVLVGIIFLAVELQQNSNIAQADSYRQIVENIADWRSEINNNPELFDLWTAYAADYKLQEMGSEDRVRVVFLVNNIFGSFESAYYAREYGIISELEWRRFEFSACNHFGFASQNQLALRFITEEFNNFLAETCSGVPLV